MTVREPNLPGTAQTLHTVIVLMCFHLGEKITAWAALPHLKNGAEFKSVFLFLWNWYRNKITASIRAGFLTVSSAQVRRAECKPSTGTHWKTKQEKFQLCSPARAREHFSFKHWHLGTSILIRKFQQEELTLRHAELKNEDVESKILLLANLVLPQNIPNPALPTTSKSQSLFQFCTSESHGRKMI